MFCSPGRDSPGPKCKSEWSVPFIPGIRKSPGGAREYSLGFLTPGSWLQKKPAPWKGAVVTRNAAPSGLVTYLSLRNPGLKSPGFITLPLRGISPETATMLRAGPGLFSVSSVAETIIKAKIQPLASQSQFLDRCVLFRAKRYVHSMFCSPQKDTPVQKYKSEGSVQKTQPIAMRRSGTIHSGPDIDFCHPLTTVSNERRSNRSLPIHKSWLLFSESHIGDSAVGVSDSNDTPRAVHNAKTAEPFLTTPIQTLSTVFDRVEKRLEKKIENKVTTALERRHAQSSGRRHPETESPDLATEPFSQTPSELVTDDMARSLFRKIQSLDHEERFRRGEMP